MKNWVCDGLDFFLGAADGLGYAKGLRRSRCDCSVGPASRNGGFSPLKQPTTPHKNCVTRSAKWKTCRVQVDKLPK